MDIASTVIFLAIAVGVAAVVYLAGRKLLGKRWKGGDRELEKVADFTSAYFRESEVDAKVDCVFLEGKGIVALIEVDPQVRFRSSYIIEQTLKEQIRRLTGKNLAGVFWRFPMVEKLTDASHAGQAYAAAKARVEEQHYDVGEVPWEEYERAMNAGKNQSR